MIGRICLDCESDDLTDEQIECPYCWGKTMGLDDYAERAWDRQQADAMSEPMPSMAALHRQAWDDRQALRTGRNFR